MALNLQKLFGRSGDDVNAEDPHVCAVPSEFTVPMTYRCPECRKTWRTIGIDNDKIVIDNNKPGDRPRAVWTVAPEPKQAAVVDPEVMKNTNQPDLTDYITTPEHRVPSNFNHPTHRIINEDGASYGETRIEQVQDTNHPHQFARLVSSDIKGSGVDPEHSMHTIMLDIDVPATLVPSSTPGHSHLYIDLPISWRQYVKIINALHDAGVIETGYRDSALKDKRSYLRMPGVTKKKPRSGGPSVPF